MRLPSCLNRPAAIRAEASGDDFSGEGFGLLEANAAGSESPPSGCRGLEGLQACGGKVASLAGGRERPTGAERADVSFGAIAAALRKGYVTASTDRAHRLQRRRRAQS